MLQGAFGFRLIIIVQFMQYFNIRFVEGVLAALHLGLQSSDERIHLAGGELDVTSDMTPGSSGTTVSFWLPIDTSGQ